MTAGRVTIRLSKHGGFDVSHDERVAEGLTFDEALGLVASLLMPERRPCTQWLKTPQEREAERSRR